jgi:spermidine synthase
VFIGAGAFGMPEKLSQRFPQAAVDVVEIDPEVVEVGRRFFRLDEFPRVRAHATDGRMFLQAADAHYDLIFGDAYNGMQYIPAHLVTAEFFSLVRQRLNPEGVYVMNLIGAIDGDGSELFWRVHNSLRVSFQEIVVFGTAWHSPAASQNLIIVASNAPLQPRIDAWSAAAGARDRATARLLGTRVKLPTDAQSDDLFTDNHNPVEFIVARQLLNTNRGHQ